MIHLIPLGDKEGKSPLPERPPPGGAMQQNDKLRGLERRAEGGVGSAREAQEQTAREEEGSGV